MMGGVLISEELAWGELMSPFALLFETLLTLVYLTPCAGCSGISTAIEANNLGQVPSSSPNTTPNPLHFNSNSLLSSWPPMTPRRRSTLAA
jgi:hypothetical protein